MHLRTVSAVALVASSAIYSITALTLSARAVYSSASPPASTSSIRSTALGGLQPLKVTSVPAIARAPHSLILAFRESCHYCQASLAFYRRLEGEITGTKGRLQLIVATTDVPSELRAYLAAQGVRAEEIVQDSLSQAGVVGTPTLVHCNRSGKVLDLWDGRLNEEQEEQVIKAIRAVGAEQ